MISFLQAFRCIRYRALARSTLLFVTALVISCVSGSFDSGEASVQGALVDRYVSPRGSDSSDGSAAHPWQTIQHAGSMAKPGMTIHVAPGIYRTGSAITTKSSGSASARIRYLSDQKWGAKIVTSDSQAWANTGEYVDIEGFDISSSNANTIIGIHGGSSYARYISNHIHDMPAAAGTCPSGGGIVMGDASSHNQEAIANVIHDVGIAVGSAPGQCNQLHGIYAGTPNCKVINNLIFRSQGKGISAWPVPGGYVIANNTIFASQDRILVGGSGSTANNIIVSNNISYKNVRYGVYETETVGTSNQYLNNIVFGNPTNWALIAGAQSNTVTADPSLSITAEPTAETVT